ncbi:alkaline phosphatase family protein [Chroococcidiopsis sp. CCMEE 29]|uniref:alkaline phosphatase family protein n=1 Tax=Chroococcidiopsis sp. CCMEE 29 TaxID=155894 RepID=UPI0020200826|nr:alkaline phosphatase family protein [Chroococcidiopsis sp. CCMEE 29]
MKKPVIAIGLDAADPSLLETWMSQGHLKNLRRLRAQGAYTRLNNLDYYRAETPLTTFLTGCLPEKTGYWAPVKLLEGTYDIEEIEAYDFTEYPPFYALGDDYRVAVFDMPHSTLSEQVNGVQVLAWGAHAPLTPSHSRPTQLLQELISQHGEHPALNKDYANCLNLTDLAKLQKALETGISRRSAICQDLLQREPWDLFLTLFGETHSAAHYLWHLSQPDHPLYPILGVRSPGDALLEVFEAVDQAIGEILAKAPEDAYVLVFATHGMGSNIMDLPSMLFLPELLYRFNFPGKFGIAPGKMGTTPKQPMTEGRARWGGWLGTVWGLKHESNPVKGFLRRNTPTKLFNRLEPLFGAAPQPDLVSFHQLQKQSDSLFYQPAIWYKPFWSQMKAFALPSFSEGYIRINLQEREPEGIVAPSEYDAFCDELSQQLYCLRDGRTGKPMVQKIIRTRQHATDRDPKLPDADLVVIWQEEHATDVVDSPDLGRIGPVPHHRTGSHRSQGFFMAQGSGIAPGSSLPVGHALDLAPTILKLMDAPIPEYCEGKPLLEVPASQLQPAY